MNTSAEVKAEVIPEPAPVVAVVSVKIQAETVDTTVETDAVVIPEPEGVFPEMIVELHVEVSELFKQAVAKPTRLLPISNTV